MLPAPATSGQCAGLVYKEVMGRRALVLGSGGVTGVAWETGLIAGLADLGIDWPQLT